MRRAQVSIVLFVTAACAALTIASCRPDLGARDSLVTRTQVLAVRGDPPEARPGTPTTYSLLVATPDGPAATTRANWAFCASPKLLTENGAASAACLTDAVRPVATAQTTVEAALPSDACALFGPEITSADLRPRDPDITGGYYQPLRVTIATDTAPVVAFGLQRITCNLANAAADVTADFGRRYVPNKNPELGPLTLTHDGSPVAFDAVPAGARITIHATWSDESPEPYVVYDLASRSVATHRETMRVSWFATAGTFTADRTGRAESEPETFTDNTWTAPADARTTHVFVVLRDARGGVAFATHEIVTR